MRRLNKQKTLLQRRVEKNRRLRCYNPIMAQGKSKKNRSREPRGATLDQLIRAQNVKPIADLKKLGSLLPEDFDPDSFIAFINAERAARRASRPRRKSA